MHLRVGAYIERMRFSAWVLFSVLWMTFVCLPVAHWVWGGGFPAKLGALDFAGGTVVHINAGISESLIQSTVKVGNPAEEILKEAEQEDYNLVIMGRKGRFCV